MDATQSGAAGKSAPHLSRLDMLNKVGEGRVKSLNNELAEGGSSAKVEYRPIQGNTDDDNQDRDGEARESGTEAGSEGGTEAGAGSEAGAADNAGTGDGDIYEFLGEDKLPKTKVRIKVDGEEQEVVVSDLLKDAQKFRAADKRLQDAALIKKNAEAEAERILAEAKAKAAQGSQGEHDGKESKENNESPSSIEDAMRKSVSQLYEGDTEQAAKAMAKAIDEAVKQRIDEAKAAGATVDRAKLTQEVREQMQWDQEIERFSSDHKDIVDDPYLLGIWQGELNKAATTAETPAEAVKQATENVAAWRKKVSGGAGGTKVSIEPDGQSERLKAKQIAKAAAVNSGTSVASGAQRPPQPQSGSDIVANMRKARGQA